MAFNSLEALREAGMISSTMGQEVLDFYAGLAQNEVEVLISVRSRLDALLPDVQAHSQQWSSPEATDQGFDAAMQCACAAWSGAGASY